MLTISQLDSNFLFLHEAQAPVRGHLQVEVSAPTVSAGFIQKWVTTQDPVMDTLTFGEAGTGTWEVIEDHRKDTLWSAYNVTYTLGETLNNQSYDGLGPVPAWLFTTEPAAPIPTIPEAVVTQKETIDTSFAASAKALTAGYPPEEQLTWPTQQSEALAWKANNTTATPYLDGLATVRGVDPATFRSQVLAKVESFMSSSQTLVGTRQKLWDQLDALAASTTGTLDQVYAVVWPANLQLLLQITLVRKPFGAFPLFGFV